MKKVGLMALHTQVTMSMARRKAEVYISLLMELNTMATGVTIKLMALELTLGLMAVFILDNVRIAIWRVLEYTLIKMVERMRENFIMIKNKGMALINGKTGECIWVSGKMASSTVWVLTKCKAKKKDKVFGKMVNALSGSTKPKFTK